MECKTCHPNSIGEMMGAARDISQIGCVACHRAEKAELGCTFCHE